MATDDLKRIQGIRNDKLHRLRLLEKQQAIQGFRTPPEVIIEIEQTRKEIEPLDYALSNPGSVNTAEEIGAGGRYLALDRKMDLVVKMLSERMDRMEETTAERLASERQDRMAGQGTHQIEHIMTAVALVLIVAGVVALLIRVF